MSFTAPTWNSKALRAHAAPLAAMREQMLHKLRTDDSRVAAYKPHYQVVRSHSTGYAQRIPGTICTRLHDLLSRGEAYTFINYDWQRHRYLNIREHFSVPIGYTTLVAQCLNDVAHPCDNLTKTDTVICVDFMLSLAGGGWEAVDFHPGTKSRTRRIKARYGIVGRALELVGVKHSVLTEADFHPVVLRNYRWLRIHNLHFDPAPLSDEQIKAVEPLLRAELADGDIDIFHAARNVCTATGFAVDKLSRTCYQLIAHGVWDVDFGFPLGPDYPVHFISSAVSAGKS